MRENPNPVTSFLEDDTGEAFDSLFGTPQPKEETPDQPPSIEAAAQEPPVPTVPEPKTEPTEAPQEQGISPFDAAFRQGQAQSRQRLKDAAAAQPPLFAYEKAEDPITDASLTFEQLRQKYQGDYPALSDPKTGNQITDTQGRRCELRSGSAGQSCCIGGLYDERMVNEA